MKKTIRKGVFETNSSSSHSLTFKNNSTFDRLYIFLTLLNHSKNDIELEKKNFEKIFRKYFNDEKTAKNDMIESFLLWLDSYGEIEDIVYNYFYKETDNKFWYTKNFYFESSFKDCDNQQKLTEDSKILKPKDKIYSIKEKIEIIKSKENTKCLNLSQCKEELLKLNYIDLLVSICYCINKYKNNEEYSKINKSIFSNFEKYYNEIFSNKNYRFISYTGLANYEEDMRFYKRIKDIFCKAYLELENKTMDELKKELIANGYNESSLSVCKFCQGCLDECDCGYENFFSLYMMLDLDYDDSDEVLYEKAKKILQDKDCFSE